MDTIGLASPAADRAVLARLEAMLYSTDDPPSEEMRARLIAQDARELAAHLRDAKYLVEQAYHKY